MRKSRDGRYAAKEIRKLDKAAKIFCRQAGEYELARTELNVKRLVAVDPSDCSPLDAELNVQAAALNEIRTTLVDSSRALGVGFDLPEVA